MNTDFQLERKLKKENPNYFELVRDTAFVMHNILDRYTLYFPDYTDHSSLHSLQVIDFCNRLIGDQIEKLNADEIYILLMACYLHDTGMGISADDYKALKEKVVSEEFIKANPNMATKDIIRNFHHEFSGKFIGKYAEIFEIPSKEYVFAIMQVSRGHRKTDLFDEKEYPAAYKLPNGNTACLPYLASLIRLADELDIARDRNVEVEYDYSEYTQYMAFRKHYAISHMEMTDDSFTLTIDTKEEDVLKAIKEDGDKLQDTLDVCRNATEQRTDFRITQTKVILDFV